MVQEEDCGGNFVMEMSCESYLAQYRFAELEDYHSSPECEQKSILRDVGANSRWVMGFTNLLIA